MVPNSFPSVVQISPEDSADVTNVLQSDWSIDFNDLDFIRQAGQGAFGRIYKVISSDGVNCRLGIAVPTWQ